MVLREGPMIKEETLDESGDSELGEEDPSPLNPLQAPEGSKQSIPGPERGDETIQRKERDTRNSNKLMEVNPNNIDLLVATNKEGLAEL